MQICVGKLGIKTGCLIILFLWLLAPQALMSQSYNQSYLDYLDSYYKYGNLDDLEAAKSSIKFELDNSLALKIQSYYYNAEIEYLLAYEKLRHDPFDQEKIEDLKNLLTELYYRYLESYYQLKKDEVEKVSLEGNTAYLFKDIFLAATIMPSANSVSPLVQNLLRRAKREKLFNVDNSFVASVSDLFEYEQPNLFGMANLVKSVWTYDRYMQITEDTPEKDSLREVVTYNSSIALDTLSSNFCKSIASFLLASTNSNRSNDAAWKYYQQCLELSEDESDFPSTGFYARNYNREIYIATTVAFIPAYCEYLFDNGRYVELLKATEYLADIDDLDQGMMENVSKEAIFWGEKSIRALQDEKRFEDSDDVYRRLHAFYKFLKPENTYSGSLSEEEE